MDLEVSGRKGPMELSSTLCKGSDEDVQIACQPCHRKGSRSATQGYCENCQEDFCTSCFNSHIVYKPCMDHKLLDKRPSLILEASSDALPIYQGKIPVLQKSQDKKPCKITGITLLTPHKLVLTDENNDSVKMADIRKKSIVSHVKLSASPHDVTTVTSTQAAVTLPTKQRISFLEVRSDELLKTRHCLKVDGSCMGIHCYKQKLVVTYSEPVKLEILSMEGQVLNTVMMSFHQPYYVTANDCSIYVSDSELQKSSVKMINWDGEVTGKQFKKGLVWSTGLALVKNGKVFVCDRGLIGDKGDGKIHKISADCMEDKVVLEDLVKPQSVCWCDKSCTLYISSNLQTKDDEDEEENYLKVYKLP